MIVSTCTKPAFLTSLCTGNQHVCMNAYAPKAIYKYTITRYKLVIITSETSYTAFIFLYTTCAVNRQDLSNEKNTS